MLKEISGLRGLFWVVLLGTALALVGCGSSGDQGPAGVAGATGATGPAGPPGTVVREQATAITLNITGASLGSTSTVDFTAVDQNGIPYAGIPASTIEMMIAKLVPGTNGDTDHWQSYINVTQHPAGVGPGTTDTVHANRDSGGTLVDNGDGTYVYTFGFDITNVTDPIAVAYEPTLTTRIAMDIRSSTLPEANNAIYDFQPSTGDTASIPDRVMVETASCNQCHSKLALHGGPRTDVRLCVTCHNPGSTEANSGNTLDFRVMIHKIHRGENLPSVVAGTDYIIYGYHDSVNDFSDVAFPQDIRNCEKCHDAANPNTPQADYHFKYPSIQACGSCHDDIDFAAGIAGGHPGGVVTDNSSCTVCHADGRIAGSVEQSHEIPWVLAAAKFQYNIISITNTGPGQFPKITYSVTDPTNNDAPYDMATDPAFLQTAGHGATRLYLDIAWSTTDYTNKGSNTVPAMPLQIDATTGTANGDGTYTVTSPAAVPTDAVGSGEVAFEGHPAGDYDGDGVYSDRIPVTSVTKYFAITDSTPVPRREVVDVTKCEKCHGQNDGLALHGNNRVDNTDLCVICHNPRNGDIAMRPADPDATPNGVNTAALDGLETRPIDFKVMIHSIHGADMRDPSDPFIVYGYGGSSHDFSGVGFPGLLNKCDTCHVSNSYEPPLASNVLGTTVAFGATTGASGFLPDTASLLDQSLDKVMTPTAAVCSGCHDGTLEKAHMEQNGASFDTVQSLIDNGTVTETCAVCHGAGKVEDVEKVHGLSN